MRCKKTELLVDQCSHCLGTDADFDASMERDLTPIGKPWPARYQGSCERCDALIGVGDRIHRTPDGYIHAHCTTRSEAA